MIVLVFFFFKQKTAYEMRISDWSSDVCSSDLVAFGRKIATIGLSMKKNVKLAREMGLLTIPESALIDIKRIGDYPDSQICVISTGSQGEPMSALTRMANQENRWLEVGARSEEPTYELQALMRLTCAVLRLQKKNTLNRQH